jgi:hypothetical protein
MRIQLLKPKSPKVCADAAKAPAKSGCSYLPRASAPRRSQLQQGLSSLSIFENQRSDV